MLRARCGQEDIAAMDKDKRSRSHLGMTGCKARIDKKGIAVVNGNLAAGMRRGHLHLPAVIGHRFAARPLFFREQAVRKHASHQRYGLERQRQGEDCDAWSPLYPKHNSPHFYPTSNLYYETQEKKQN